MHYLASLKTYWLLPPKPFEGVCVCVYVLVHKKQNNNNPIIN